MLCLIKGESITNGIALCPSLAHVPLLSAILGIRGTMRENEK